MSIPLITEQVQQTYCGESKIISIIINFASNNAFPVRNIIDLRTSTSYVCWVTVGVKDIAAILKDCINKC
jgi:hypothetical protein